jgi:hypothetical protein
VTINGKKPAISKSFFLLKLFKKIFLPQGEMKLISNEKSKTRNQFYSLGFPDSVSTDYIDYQKWDTLQAFASTITTCLATHSVLKGSRYINH